ncbi:MAG: 50S ribosomal protein L29 [Nanoarchaeota archaeon]|nr:50S ribosomal protein L29 [Nanoarchaeota archaeon]MBU1644485.1 50S ribosomal protein L29 [Nanoarchaeota archaeon]MBU1976489.1 50S ribosomal protein L29 [Nanoarchaeota archaeon]
MKVTKDLRALSEPELNERLKEFKKELLKLNVQVASGTAAQSSGKLRQIKKNVARVNTILKERGAD